MTPDPTTVLCAVLRGERELPAGEDGERLVALARLHRVDRLLPNQPPESARLDLLLDEVASRELSAALAALEAQDIEPLVFKGAALAHTHYPASWRRPRLDADILIAPEDRARAFDVLHDIGYVQPPVTSGDLVSSQTMFVRTNEIGTEHVIDLHWRIGNPQAIAQAFSHAELVARSAHVVVCGRPMRVPSPVDALLIACVHRAAHHRDAQDLIWLYDIHLIAQRLNLNEWGSFVGLAIERQIAAISARGLMLAMHCFHTFVPQGVMDALSLNGPSTRTGPAKEPSAIFLRGNLRKIDGLLADLRVLGPRQGTRLLREHLFPPVSYVRGKYGVRSRALLPAFYAYRILIGASKWLRSTGE